MATKRRVEKTENDIRTYKLPVKDTKTETSGSLADDSYKKSSTLLFSLLQSRLNWTKSVFTKFRNEEKTGRKQSSSRRKAKNLFTLGVYTIAIGGHHFSGTTFYAARRSESWIELAKTAQILIEDETHNDGDAGPVLTFSDIVFEFKENPGELFLFPKEAILEALPDSSEVLASFLLPLDPSIASDFDLTPEEKISRWGATSNIPKLQEHASKPYNITPSKQGSDVEAKDDETYSPTTMRIFAVDESLLNELRRMVYEEDAVRMSMTKKMKKPAKRQYLQLLSDDPSVTTMAQSAYTVPEMTSGPVLAEKKRNELANAILLGKRPRKEHGGPEVVVKSRASTLKDDGFRRCAYCTTRHTAMWQSGPAGHGTLCNGCGNLWKQGKILVDAPVISWDEEKQLERERRELTKANEPEVEVVTIQPKEGEKHKQKTTRKMVKRPSCQPANTSNINNSSSAANTSKQPNIGQVAAQLLQQQQQVVLPPGASQSIMTPQGPISFMPLPPGLIPSELVPPVIPAAIVVPAPSIPPRGIPLPTLSISFGEHAFAHPDCSVILVDNCVAIRLSKAGFQSTTINIDKHFLQDTDFTIDKEGDATNRDILTVSCVPTGGGGVYLFNTCLIIPHEKSLKITFRFLEKVDEHHVEGVVTRVFGEWLKNCSESASEAPMTTLFLA
ncbi:hypothetical protein BCR43DRAFT_564854 [Syncephalastrum racemosum]|uniref:GATA-type domain-containing protein n=1 Tax=Syncephalastrum racemosum TaxID=13706 RepID=A0A1X2H7Q4_SYNRA|nr:hypothetical protein BCR43DRAFT_564854 [Syncephalastrum racemosum]